MKHTMKAAAVLVLAASAGNAVELTGGELRLGYSAFDASAGGETLSRWSLDGSAELGFNQDFAAQLDIGISEFNASGLNIGTATLHGIYHLNGQTSLGAFYGTEDTDFGDVDYYGLEIGYGVSGFEVEGYLGIADGSGADGNLFGITGAVDIAPNWQMTGGYERADFDGGVDMSKFAVGVKLATNENVAFTAELGRGDFSVSSASAGENFISFGAEITFGAKRGATFGRRGVFNIIPGL